MRFSRLFTEHPASVGESYTQHFAHALSFGTAMLWGALACLVHAVFPWLCTTVASRTVVRLHSQMVTSRPKPRVNKPSTRSQPNFLAEHI